MTGQHITSDKRNHRAEPASKSMESSFWLACLPMLLGRSVPTLKFTPNVGEFRRRNGLPLTHQIFMSAKLKSHHYTVTFVCGVLRGVLLIKKALIQ